MKVIRWLDDHFEEVLLVVFLVAITIVSFLQVVIRKLPWIPALTWAEEFCRFAWIWSVFLSLPYTIKRGNMLRVTVLLDAMPTTIRKFLNIFVDLVNLAVMTLLFYYAIPLVRDRFISAETSPAMLWPMWAIYASMLLGFGLATFRAIQALVVHIKQFGEKPLTTVEQTMQAAEEELAAAQAAEGVEPTKEGEN